MTPPCPDTPNVRTAMDHPAKPCHRRLCILAISLAIAISILIKLLVGNRVSEAQVQNSAGRSQPRATNQETLYIF